MADDESTGDPIMLPSAGWVNDDRLPVLMVAETHVGSLAQYEGLHFLTFGQYDIPIPIGDTDEERAQSLRGADPVPLRVVGRFAMPNQYFRTFVDSFREYLERIDQRDAAETLE